MVIEKRGRTANMFARVLKDKDFKSKLKANEIDLMRRNNEKYTLFLYAATSEKYAEQLSLILRYHKDKVFSQVHRKERNALHVAVLKNNVKGLKVLLEAGFNPNETSASLNYEKPIIKATELNYFEITKLLLEYGAKAFERHTNLITPLFHAVKNKNIEMVKLLINNNADVNAETSGGKMIRAAMFYGFDEGAICLHERGANLTHLTLGEQTILHTVSAHGKLSTLEYFYERFSDINFTTMRGESAIFSACRWGKYENIQFLLRKGAEFLKCNDEGESPLVVALKNEELEIAQLLISHGANLKEEMNKVNKYLFYNIRRVHVVEFLLRQGANINVKDDKGRYVALTRYTFHKEYLRLLDKYIDKMESELEEEYTSNKFKYLVKAK